MYHFCTYFDHNYILKGLALYHSLVRHCLDFRLFVLCLSKECYDVLTELGLDNMHLISLNEIEKTDKDLLEARQNRSLVEYYFTMTPILPLYIFNSYPHIDIITYLDSDLYFFESPEPIFKEIANKSIAIIAHRFPPTLKEKEIRGKYNVGWITFRRDENGLSCLNWYRKKCIEWCYDKVEANRYADQKYLDYFQNQFREVIDIQHKGGNLAPWNIENYNIRTNNNKIYVDNDKLIFFHFNGLKHILGPLYDSGFSIYSAKLNKTIRKHIYAPYLRVMFGLEKEIKSKVAIGQLGRLNGIRGEGNRTRFDFLKKVSPQVFEILKKYKRTISRINKVLITKTYIWYYKN